MADSDTEWSTISLPKSAFSDVQEAYSRNKESLDYGTDEPLWGFVLRAVSELDGADE